MKFKKIAALLMAALITATFAACSNNNELQNVPESLSDSLPESSQLEPSQSEEPVAEKSPEEIAEEVGYMTLEENTAAGYYPVWMQPHTIIIYDENCVPEIIEGGELTPEDLVGREDIADVGFSQEGDEAMKIEPNTKAEYDLHGFITNIYHLWPDGTYNLDYPPEG